MFDILIHMFYRQIMTHEQAHEKSRQALIQAAKALFASNGFKGVTVREIAARAGLNPSLVSYYFDGKEGLYRACIEQYGRTRLAAAQRILTPAQSFEELSIRLKLVLEEILEALMSDPDISKMVIREIESEAPIAGDVLSETLVKMAEAFIGFFEMAREQKLIREDVDTLFLTQLIQGSLMHFVRTDFIRKKHFNLSLEDPQERKDLVYQLHRLVLDGVRNSPQN